MSRLVFQWKQDGDTWTMYAGRRKFGSIVRDAVYPDMWRRVIQGGVTDMANLTRAKDAVRVAADRELDHQQRAKSLDFTGQNEAIFEAASSPMRKPSGTGPKTHPWPFKRTACFEVRGTDFQLRPQPRASRARGYRFK
jgi:hypothetical protein